MTNKLLGVHPTDVAQFYWTVEQYPRGINQVCLAPFLHFISYPFNFGTFFNRVNCKKSEFNSRGADATEFTQEVIEFIKEHYLGANSPWSEVLTTTTFHVDNETKTIWTETKYDPELFNTKSKRALFCNFLIALRTTHEFPRDFRFTRTLVDKYGVPFRKAAWVSVFLDSLTDKSYSMASSGQDAHRFLRSSFCERFIFGDRFSQEGYIEDFNFNRGLWEDSSKSGVVQSFINTRSNQGSGSSNTHEYVMGRFKAWYVKRANTENTKKTNSTEYLVQSLKDM